MQFNNLTLQVWDLQTGLVFWGRLTPINNQMSLSAEIGLLLTCVVNLFSNLIQSSGVPLNGVILSPCNFDLHTFAVVSSLTSSRSSGCQLLISPPKTLFSLVTFSSFSNFTFNFSVSKSKQRFFLYFLTLHWSSPFSPITLQNSLSNSFSIVWSPFALGFPSLILALVRVK